MIITEKKIVLYTCIYGNYDVPRDSVRQNFECDYICLTDNPNMQSNFFKMVVFEPVSKTGKEVPAHDRNIVNTVLARSDLRLLDPLKGYDICIYMDGNIHFSKPDVL